MGLLRQISLLASCGLTLAAYAPVREYSGDNFFSQWNFFEGTDWNLTNGDVNFLNQGDAMAQKLTYINEANNAIIKVDDFSEVVWDNKRNSIRLESKDLYEVGSLWIMDAVHIPYGCSVWPSFWTRAQQGWPLTGEIDIIEAINLMPNNQMAVHADLSCKVPQDQQNLQSGTPLATNNCTANSGCTVRENKPASFGASFAEAKGGVYATQFDAAGIFIWFWSRPDIPKSIQESTSSSSIDLSDWGTPSASFPSSSCNTSTFGPQMLVITLTLCGDWANAPFIYNQTCTTGPTGLCYQDNVLGNGSNYHNAYFEIPWIRAYSVEGTNTTTPSTSTTSPPSSSTGGLTTPTVRPNSATAGVVGISSLLSLLVAGALSSLL